MRNTKGQFIKGVKSSDSLTPEQLEKKKKSLVNQWKERDNYHGMYGTKFHTTWRAMRNRCDGNSSKEANRKYHDKGIMYEDRWYYFKAFYEDMFPVYVEGHQLDRIDNKKGYSKDNCRWVTAKQNNNNRSSNIRIEMDGQEKTLSEWADFYGIKFTTVRNKYYRMYKKGKCALADVFKTRWEQVTIKYI